ncbi:MAG: arsenate reductase [Actinomycetia bacterium]|nr:arsenate reductase [Actinomycetes bacterium]MCP4960787.1 arsenate reductase [Actinomycetes bacterium]
MAVAEEKGLKPGEDVGVVLYMKTPPDRTTLEHIVEILEDPVEDLVRKDASFKKLELDEDDYVDNPAAVIDLLINRKALMQRPLLVKEGKAIIGRPKDRVGEFLD